MRRPDLEDRYGPEARYAVESEAMLPTAKEEQEIACGLERGLHGADSIVDRRIPTFSHGEPHFAGINTFLKAPYVIEDVRRYGECDVAALGAPFADLGDVFTIPGNIEKTFDQISKARHLVRAGYLPRPPAG
jgi:agmatinase